MARQYLGVPATSATVERLFSVVGFAFADRRKRQSEQARRDAGQPRPSLSSICLLKTSMMLAEAHMLMPFGSLLSSICDLHAMR